MNTIIRHWDIILRIVGIIMVIILIVVIVIHLEEVQLMLSNPCQLCIERTGCECWCFKYPEDALIIPNPVVTCDGLELKETSKCLTKWLTPYFNYTKMEDNPNRSIEDVLRNGGDCYDYTLMFMRIAEQMNITSYKDSTIPGHTFLILKDEKGYCIIDQQAYFCIPYG